MEVQLQLAQQETRNVSAYITENSVVQLQAQLAPGEQAAAPPLSLSLHLSALFLLRRVYPQADSLSQCWLLVPPGSAAVAAKSHQSCLTLCDPMDGSPPGSPVYGILQARILEWVAISFSIV